jgi:NhaP-type Na+/H+ or K+/H+ antiporter
MTAFWYLITALGLIAATINFVLASMRRQQVMVALVRGVAGVVSLALAIGIVVGKMEHIKPPFPLEWQTVFIATGVFVFAVLFLPSYLDKGASEADEKKLTLQQRAARPAKATIRLQNTGSGSDEWVN